MARARTSKYRHGIKDAHAFGKEVASWWRLINPAWRKADASGTPIEGEMTRDMGKDWAEFDIPGPNGLLNVLICLRWWAEAAGDARGAQWDAMVADVSWVQGEIAKC